MEYMETAQIAGHMHS